MRDGRIAGGVEVGFQYIVRAKPGVEARQAFSDFGQQLIATEQPNPDIIEAIGYRSFGSKFGQWEARVAAKKARDIQLGCVDDDMAGPIFRSNGYTAIAGAGGLVAVYSQLEHGVSGLQPDPVGEAYQALREGNEDTMADYGWKAVEKASRAATYANRDAEEQELSFEEWSLRHYGKLFSLGQTAVTFDSLTIVGVTGGLYSHWVQKGLLGNEDIAANVAADKAEASLPESFVLSGDADQNIAESTAVTIAKWAKPGEISLDGLIAKSQSRIALGYRLS